jgi:hypothetical protein
MNPPWLSFQASRLESFAEFELLRQESAPLFDARYLYERSLASHDNAITLEGTCGACLSVTSFAASTLHAEILPDGRRVPNWREELACGCEARLINRYRAVMHLLGAKVGLHRWTEAIVFGSAGGLVPPLESRIARCRVLPRLDRATGGGGMMPRLSAGDESAHIVLSLDYLQRVPALDDALAEIARVLRPGGRFVFTVPFRFNAPLTVSYLSHLPRVGGLLPADLDAEVHEIGWDILDRLRSAGFADAGAHLYWSEELGYLGPYNFIFSACR